MNSRFHDDIQIPVLYFSQLVGMAFEIPSKEIGLQRLLIQPKLPAAVQGG